MNRLNSMRYLFLQGKICIFKTDKRYKEFRDLVNRFFKVQVKFPESYSLQHSIVAQESVKEIESTRKIP